MKSHLFWKCILFFLTSVALSPATGQVTRTYRYNCVVKDGSKFLLSLRYKYYPFAVGHQAKHLIVGDWAVQYQSVSGKKSAVAPSTVPFSDAKSANCGRVGKIDGIPIVYKSYLMENGKWFSPKLIPFKLFLSSADVEQPPALRKLLDEMDVVPANGGGFVVPRNNRLVYEKPLLRSKAQSDEIEIVAVYKSFSLDQGITWSDPAVTTDAEIYELGKSEEAQSFAAVPAKNQAND